MLKLSDTISNFRIVAIFVIADLQAIFKAQFIGIIIMFPCKNSHTYYNTSYGSITYRCQTEN
jgi:hypothetical protein